MEISSYNITQLDIILLLLNQNQQQQKIREDIHTSMYVRLMLFLIDRIN